MFWFAIAIMSLIATAIFLAIPRRLILTPTARTFKRTAPLVSLGIFVASALSTLLVKVPPGHVGVPVTFGKVGTTVYGPGLSFKSPVARIAKISVQERVYTMSGIPEEGVVKGDDSIKVLTNEGMEVDIDITVQYRILADKAPWILNTKVWGAISGFESQYVRPEIRRAIRDVSARYSAHELYSTRRAKVGDDIRSLAEKLLAKNGCTCVAVNLRNVVLPAGVTKAIERKKEREQESQEYEYKLAVERKEADRKRVEAEGIRDYQITVRKGLDAQLIQWKGIEAAEKLAASDNAKVIIFGDSKIPVILGGQ